MAEEHGEDEQVVAIDEAGVRETLGELGAAVDDPFLLNAVPAKQARHIRNHANTASVRGMQDEEAEQILAALGIDKAHLFFARYLVIAEGATEVAFLDAYFRARLGAGTQASLVKVISTDGVENVPGFAAALAQVHSVSRAVILYDTEASDRVQPVIARLAIPTTNTFVVGTKEFEDAFDGAVLERCWSSYVAPRGARLAPGWRREAIDQLKAECLANGDKFSKKLSGLNAGGQPKMTKPKLGWALGTHVQDGELPRALQDLCDRLVATAHPGAA